MSLPPDLHPGHIVIVAEVVMTPPDAGRQAATRPLAFGATAKLLLFRRPGIGIVVPVTVLAPPLAQSLRPLHGRALLTVARVAGTISRQRTNKLVGKFTNYRKFLHSMRHWRWPNQNLAGNAFDFYTSVLGASFEDAMQEITKT